MQIRFLKFFFDDLAIIYSSKRRIKARGRLLGYYLLFSLRYFLKTKRKKESFLGFTVEFDDYYLFYGLWKEIFLYELYRLPDFKADPTIVDLGANIGMSVLYFKYLYPHAKIIAFEPSSINARVLRRNVAINRLTNVEIREAAASDRDGQETLYESSVPSEADSVWQENNPKGRPVSVGAENISPYLKGVDLLKFDIEGSEYRVLESTDLAQVAWVIGEVHQRRSERNEGLHRILKKLDDQNFRYSLQSGMRPMDFVSDPDYAYLCFIFAKKQKGFGAKRRSRKGEG